MNAKKCVFSKGHNCFSLLERNFRLTYALLGNERNGDDSVMTIIKKEGVSFVELEVGLFTMKRKLVVRISW